MKRCTVKLVKTPFCLILSLQFGDGVGCDCNTLNGTFVTSAANSEVPVLTPTSAPAVFDNPVLLASFLAAAIAYQQHCVVGQLEGIEGVSEACVVVDAPLVGHEVSVDLWKQVQYNYLYHQFKEPKLNILKCLRKYIVYK